MPNQVEWRLSQDVTPSLHFNHLTLLWTDWLLPPAAGREVPGHMRGFTISMQL